MRASTAKLLTAVRELAASGLTRPQVAEKLGASIQTIGNIGRKYGVEFRHASKGRGVDTSRGDAMAAMYLAGKTLQEIGDFYGVTRERVRQIITRNHGLTRLDGGQHSSTEQKRAAEKARRDAACLAKYGCTNNEYRRLVRIGKEMMQLGSSRGRTPIGAYSSQRANAAARGIEWNITHWEWWQVWQKSGKWDKRGRTDGSYVMCRFGDVGAYEVGNVYIATCNHNCSVRPNFNRKIAEARAA